METNVSTIFAPCGISHVFIFALEPQKMLVTHLDYFDYGKKPVYPHFEPHAGIKMALGSWISLVYLCIYHVFYIYQAPSNCGILAAVRKYDHGYSRTIRLRKMKTGCMELQV